MKSIKKNTSVKIILAGAVMLACLAYVATPASATPPERRYDSFAGATFTIEGLCGFEVTQTVLVGDIEETTYFDRHGNITMVRYFVIEQDAFTANGVILIGEPYTASIIAYFENGEITNLVAQGVLQRVRLPDGRLFIAAGRVDPFSGNVLDPDHGAFVNADAFCAAFSQ